MTIKFQALRDFGYNGARRLPGEVFDRGFLRNDERLMREDGSLRYVRVLTTDELKGIDMSHCDQCGRDFASEHFYHAHLPVVHLPSGQVAEPPAVTRMEQDYPGGMLIDRDGRPQQVRAARR